MSRRLGTASAFRLALVAVTLCLLSVGALAVVAADPTTSEPPGAPTLPPAAPPGGGAGGGLTPAERRARNRERSIGVDASTWIWVPCVVVGVFLVFLLSSRKFACFDGESLRIWMTHYVSLETLYNTLEGADEEFADEQRKVEYGHQWFEFFGLVTLMLNFFFGNGQNQPYAFVYLTVLQLILLFLSILVDVVMIRCEYLRIIRSVNTKLRFAHCTYQALLFCVDSINASNLSTLPLDCYFWAVTHYAYEAVGLFLEGLNMIGMSEFVIILLVVQHTLVGENQTTGAVSAFGLTCLSVSCASIVGGMIFKFVSACRHGKDEFRPVEEGSGHGHGGHGHGDKKSAASLDRRHSDLNGAATTPPSSLPSSVLSASDQHRSASQLDPPLRAATHAAAHAKVATAGAGRKAGSPTSTPALTAATTPEPTAKAVVAASTEGLATAPVVVAPHDNTTTSE